MTVAYKLALARQAAMFANHLGMLDGYRFLRACLVKSQVAILMYHRVVPQRDIWFLPYSITVSDFENQLKYLIKQYTILSLDELVDHIYEQKPLPKKAVVITLDDGYKDNYRYAYPILKKYGVPATIFLATGYIDNGELFWWDKITYIVQHTMLQALELGHVGSYSLGSNHEQLKTASTLVRRLAELPEQKRNMLIEEIAVMSAVNIPAGLGKELIVSWDEVREMSHDGITIGAHSVTHRTLATVLPKQARYEIIQSKKTIEERIEQAVTAFSYPGGRFSNDTTSLLKDIGFRCALTSVPRMTTSESNPYELGRLVAGWTFYVFKAFLCGLYPDLHTLASRMNRIWLSQE